MSSISDKALEYLNSKKYESNSTKSIRAKKKCQLKSSDQRDIYSKSRQTNGRLHLAPASQSPEKKKTLKG